MAYTIASGDTLSGIASKNKTTVADLLKLNPTITDPNKIYAGQSLNLPTIAPTGGYSTMADAPTPMPTPTPSPLGTFLDPLKQFVQPAVNALTPVTTPTPTVTPTVTPVGTTGGFSTMANAPKITAPLDTTNLDATKMSQAVKAITANIPNYQKNPAGFREKYINTLTKMFTEPYRGYISEQVYKLMPDITTPVAPPVVPPVNQPVVPPVDQLAIDAKNKEIADKQAEIARLQALQDKVTAAGEGADINPVTQEITYPNAPLGEDKAPVDNTQAIIDAITKALGTSAAGDSDYRKQMTDMIASLQQQNTDYLNYLKSQPTAADIYSKYRTELGIPEKETALGGIQAQIVKTEGLLNSLEDDINARISGFGISEPQRRGILASKQTPLTKQLGELGISEAAQQATLTPLQNQLASLMGYAQTEQERQSAIAKAPMEMTQSLLPITSEMAQYQSPQEKMSAAIQQESLLKQLGLGEYVTKPTAYEPIGGASTGYYAFNPSTGKAEQVVSPVVDSPSISDKYGTGTIGEYNFYAEQEQLAGRTPKSFNDYQTYDANRKAQATALATSEGGLTTKGLSIFNTIVGKYQASPLIQAADKMSGYLSTIKSAGEGGSTPQKDLNLIYAYIKALDWGDSAVREGEISLGMNTGSLKQELEAKAKKLMGTGLLADSQRKNYITAASSLIDNVNKAALAKEKSFTAQAKVTGIEGAWNEYLSAFNPSYRTGGASTSSGGGDMSQFEVK